MEVLPRHPRESNREYALRVLKENIVSTALAPGSMVSENELAAQLALSRTPVREALLELSKAKIVEILPQRGSRVTLIDYALVEEARFLREVLERAVAELVCQTADAVQLEALSQNVRLQEYHLENHQLDPLMKLDDDFHGALFKIAGKWQLHELINGFTIHFDRVRSLSLYAVKELKIVADHRAILNAIAARDAGEAQRLMTKHLNRYRVDEQELRGKYPRYFG
ncbi:MAG: GntR family transcriptional regulator [Clostridia bacterium]